MRRRIVRGKGALFLFFRTAMAARDADRATVRTLVAELPPEFSEVLILHYWEQWPLARIAEFLAIPLATVKWRMYRGRRLLFCRLT